MLPNNWLNSREVPDVIVDIFLIFYNGYYMPKFFFAEKYFESWYLKIHSPCNYLQIFNEAAIIDKCGTTKHYPPTFFEIISKKRQDHMLQA